MARPIVLVFQEFADLSVTPATPDLNCLVVGPAYHIQDFPVDRANLEVASYGELHAAAPYSPPTANTPAIILAAPPNTVAGAWVDPASVAVYFDEVQARLAQGSDGVTTTVAPLENSFESSTGNFVTNGVQAGDTLIVTLSTASTTLALAVTSVESETVLYVTSNFVADDTNLSYRVERTLSDQRIDPVFTILPVDGSSNEITVLGGVTVPVDYLDRTVTYGRVFVAYRARRTDLQFIDSINSVQDIETKIGRIDARNPLAAGVFVAKQNAGPAPIQFFGVESQDVVGYTKARDTFSADDTVYSIVPMITSAAVTAMFKADNEVLADPGIALSTGVPQKFRIVIGTADMPLYEDLVSPAITGTAEELVGATPSGQRQIQLSSLDAMAGGAPLMPGDRLTLTSSATVPSIDGTYTVAHINSPTSIELDEDLGVTVSAPIGVNYTVLRPTTGTALRTSPEGRSSATSSEDVVLRARAAGTAAGALTYELVDTNTTPGGIHAITDVGGVSTLIQLDLASGSITAQQLVDAVNTGAGVSLSFSGSVNLSADTPNGATLVTLVSAQPAQALSATSGAWVGTAGTDELTSLDLADDVFIRMYDANASFYTAGVLPGDILEITTGSSTSKHAVEQVISEQRLEIKNIVAGAYQSNTSRIEYELPHTDDRSGTGTLVTPGTVNYRVYRELTKDQQVAALVSISQSLVSRRAVLTWPNSVKVAGLPDGAQPTSLDGTTPEADPQEGYYMGCVVGGMTAGLPSHQGFSRYGTAGIERIYGASDYFSEKQLTDISDGGWYVFKQDTPSSLPYCIHQLTTDPATLESGEYSIVKNFDFVSLFYIEALNPFIGVWNINNDTIGFIRQALNSSTENLKLRRVARIGAPLNSATVTSVAISDVSADRLEAYIEVDLPKPLNVIGLHLVG